MRELNDIIERLRKADKIAIYGAKVIAYGIYSSLWKVFGIRPNVFLVSDTTRNTRMIDEIPVKAISDEKAINQYLILIATPEVYHEDIRVNLLKYEVGNTIFVNSHIEYLIMSAYYTQFSDLKCLGINCFTSDLDEEEIDKNVIDKDNKAVAKILLVKSQGDVQLKESHSTWEAAMKEWVFPFQAGKANAVRIVADDGDDCGINISSKNDNYSELTATYWAWKNVDSKYKGIFHYRRLLKWDSQVLAYMEDGKADVLLPLPFLCYPDTSVQYKRYISEQDIQVFLAIMKQIYPTQWDEIKKIINGHYLYNYNIVVAKAEIFDQYCQWMFPVLEAIEEYYQTRQVIRNDRYLGYIGEVLTSCYFLLHRKELKLVHSEKIWLI
jgi:hypothetical protein